MKNIILIPILLVLVTSFLFQNCNRKKATAPVTDAQAVETQKYVNRYFHKDVIPKLTSTWDSIGVSGSVTYEYVYSRTGDNEWKFNKVSKKASTLTPEQDAMAMELMSRAVTGTQFEMESRQLNDSLLYLYWAWPVPFPKGTFDLDKGTFIALDNGGGGTGGCDGKGTVAYCQHCADWNNCEKVCVGYQTCTLSPNSCFAAYACASGGAFGSITGGNVMQ